MYLRLLPNCYCNYFKLNSTLNLIDCIISDCKELVVKHVCRQETCVVLPFSGTPDDIRIPAESGRLKCERFN